MTRAVPTHQDVTGAFYRAVPPRPTPWRRRLMWRALLAFAATPLAIWLLRRRSGTIAPSDHD